MILSDFEQQQKNRKNRRKMTKSGAHCEGNENRKSQKPFFFANWTILSIFKKNFFWMIQNFQNPDLTSKKNFIGSRFFPDLKFSGVVPNLPIYHFWSFWDFLSSTFWEMVEKPPKNTVFLKLLNDQIFYQKSGRVRGLRILIFK